MRKKKLIYNTLGSFGNEIVTLICGFILPRFILSYFGSELNGLVNSITQFLQVIAFLDFGVGAVIQSSLYKPLVDQDEQRISAIMSSATRFFRRIGTILVVYTVVLMLLYPQINAKDYGYSFVSSLIFVMSISLFAQYYYGIADKILLIADQRGYIYNIVQAMTHISNTVACIVLIKLGASIHIVRLSTSLIYLLRPLLLRQYVNRHYHIDYKVKYDAEPIKQKWNGFAQHISAIILDNSDTAILTVFSTLTNVSIYSIYHMVVYGIKQLFTTMCSGIQSLWGEMWARREKEKLTRVFIMVEWLIHMSIVFLFGCAAILVVPFVKVYTFGITDTNYIVPSFAVLITIAHGLHCIRLPYHILIKAAGHYRQTQHNYIIATLINIVISVVMVKLLGLIGVAIGTLIAMLYQTCWMIWYDGKYFIKRKVRTILKLVLCDVLCCLLGYVATCNSDISEISYASWLLLAVKTAVIWICGMIAVNMVFYRQYMLATIKWMKKRTKKKT